LEIDYTRRMVLSRIYYSEADVIEVIKKQISLAASESELAREKGINRGSLSHAVNGIRPLSRRIARAFGFTPVYTPVYYRKD